MKKRTQKGKKKELLRVPYALAVYGKEEKRAVMEVLNNPLRIVPGERVRAFEGKISALYGKKHGIMVNSGSSANLIALDALNLPKGSEILTPALTFATTLAPIIQLGFTPVLVDVDPRTYQIDLKQLQERITKKTKALMIPLLIGNVPDMVKLKAIAAKHKLAFIEDSCDTLGATFNGKPTGYYSDASTTSFYASHIITAAGAGGMVSFKDSQVAKRGLIKANWGRESTLFGLFEKSEDIKKRFAGVIEGEPYDAKFIFSELGYNFQSSELNAAFGLEQLKRYPGFLKKRQENFKILLAFFKQYEQYFVLPETDKRTKTAWLAFPLTLREGAPFTRFELTKYLEEENIQTRPIFTGNVMRQPGFKKLLKERNGTYTFPVADGIMRRGFLIGCHHGLTSAHLKRVQTVFNTFLKKY